MKIVKPRLRQSYAVEVLPPRALFLLGEHRQLVFEGEVYVLLAPLLDGRHTFGELMAQVGTVVSVQEVYGAIANLERRGCLIEAEGEPNSEHTAFWDHLGVSAAGARARLATACVGVVALGDVEAAPVAAVLAQAGFRVGAEETFTVVAVDDYLHPDLEQLNQQALQSGRPWMLLKPVGMVLWVGPVFRPGQTACWKCLSQRLQFNRQVEYYLQTRGKKTGRFHTSRARLPAASQAGLQLAATELAKAVVLQGPGPLDNKLLTLDVLSLEFKEHVLNRRPQCPACGDPGVLDFQPLTLQSRPKPPAVRPDHRTATAAETVRRYQHHISPLTGVVTALRSRSAGEHDRMHNYVAAHYFPMVSDDMALLRLHTVAVSGGKGETDTQARVSALAEAIERYSGVAWGDEPSIKASWAELREQAVHPRDLLLFSERQYREREAWNKREIGDQHYVPEPLPDAAVVAWSPAWSLTHQRRLYVPKAYCFYGHRDPGQYFCRCDSNGDAAGNTLEEAIVQGFLELVERDAVALWWYNRIQRPAVDTASFRLPYWEALSSSYRELRRDLYALDLTSDLGIPTIAVVSRQLDRPVENIIVGFGSHLDPQTALLRALTEANQYLPALQQVIAPAPGVPQFHHVETIRWWQTATYANQPYLVPQAGVQPRVLADFPRLAADDVLDDVQTCLAAAARRSLEVLVVNQTRPDLGAAVVKVIVPGMRHFWRRLGPGRLYTVPVERGWLPGPLEETQLNPVSCFV